MSKKINAESIDVREKILELLPKYENLGKNLVQAIKLLLDNNNIRYVSVYFRVKELTSFLEKVERKGYDDPIAEIEDICGVRIICYYQSDIEKISSIISHEFNVMESDHKEQKLNADQFGYRSLHFIATIKEEWSKVPNYNGLENLKAEIQVRTILMHAWAEIEHNLAYKSEAHTPEKFKRRLFRISAKLEEADEQFEDLKNESIAHQKELLKNAKNKTLLFTNDTPINIDTLQAFLDYYFPSKHKDIKSTTSLLKDIIQHDFKFGDLAKIYDKIKPHLEDIEKHKLGTRRWAQVGVARLLMSLKSEKYSKRGSGAFHELTEYIIDNYPDTVK
jgi:putative GTP pyrophosphokinase